MQSREKVVLRYYNDMGKHRGNCTWGAGILAHKGVCSEEELARKVTLAQADVEFARRVAEAERYVKHGVRKTELNQEQFDALVSLTFNAGIRNVQGVYELVNKQDFDGAASSISRMTKVTVIEKGRKKQVVASGLIGRRAEESAPFKATAKRAANR